MIRIQTALNMIIMRSKRACRLTAGKFASVDLPTFLAVCESINNILFFSIELTIGWKFEKCFEILFNSIF